MAGEWTSNVKILPNIVGDGKLNRVSLVNNSDRKLAFKLKTTRADQIKPNCGLGILPPGGGKTGFLVDYASPSRQLSDNDHITILLQEVPESTKSATQFWKEHPKNSHRCIVPVRAKPNAPPPAIQNEPAKPTPTGAAKPAGAAKSIGPAKATGAAKSTGAAKVTGSSKAATTKTETESEASTATTESEASSATETETEEESEVESTAESQTEAE